MGSPSALLGAPLFVAAANSWHTSIAMDSFSPTVRKRISLLPVSESKCHAPLLETNGIGKGQFSAPMYNTRFLRLHGPVGASPDTCFAEVTGVWDAGWFSCSAKLGRAVVGTRH